MALPDPGEFSSGIVTTTWLNAMRDLALAALNPPSTVADRLASQSIQNSTGTLMAFDTQIFDNYDMFTPTSSSITLAESGLFVVTAGATWAPNATGVRIISIQQNGADVPGALDERVALGGGAPTYQLTSQHVVGSAGDTITLNTFQTSGGALGVTGRIGMTRVSG